jgi:hypothetical protein
VLLPLLGCTNSAGVAPVADAAGPDISRESAATDNTGGDRAIIAADTGEPDATAVSTPDSAVDDEVVPAPTDAGDNSDEGALPTDAEGDTADDAATALPDAASGVGEDAASVPADATDDAAMAGPGDAAGDTGDDARAIAAVDAFDDAGPEAGADATVSVPVIPVQSGSLYTFAFGDTTFAVDASTGARIVTFSFAGHNILTTPATGDPSNYGSTFWSSPQTDWNWPPPTQIDPGPYVGSVVDGILSLTGANAPALGLSVSKKFSVDSATGVVTIQYGLVNHGTQARSVAPWEITRVAAGGLTFFPMGTGTPSKGSQDLLTLQIVDNVAWFAYDKKLITNDQKVFADGSEGWIAHVDGDLLLVKAFTDTPAAQAAPGEAEIEIYTNAAHTYIEVENQGAYSKLAPAAQSQWTVRWFLRKLDPSIAVTVGSADLLRIVRALVTGA